MLQLDTPRLVLVAATLEHVQAELRGSASLRTLLGAFVPDDWPPGEYDRAAQEYFLARLSSGGPSLVGWLTWYAMSRPTVGGPARLVAEAGFFGPPSDGAVEIGYSVAPGARGCGYATEFVTALCSFAFSHDVVRTIVAHTVPSNVPSWRVLLRCGFKEAPVSSRPGTTEYTLAPRCRRARPPSS